MKAIAAQLENPA